MIEIEFKPEGEKYTFDELCDIISKLRSEEGCPWDRAQTHYSLVKPMIEEAYEAVEAIEKNSREKMVEELGDVLLQVIYHCDIALGNGEFEFSDITDRVARKMIGRHTHIFGTATADNASEALANWEEAKLKEKGFTTLSQDLNDIPKNFPALMRAEKTAKKIRKSGEFSEPSGNFGNLGDLIQNEEKTGELLYEIARLSEARGIDPELALKRYTDRIIEEKSR